jgi:hypothetical protein
LKCNTGQETDGICTTDHGVYLKNGDDCTPIFINDANIFGVGSERLRWPSVVNAVKSGDYVAVQTFAQLIEQENLYIINTKEGQIVRVNNE